MTEQQVQRGASTALALRSLPRSAHLTEDLALAEHGALEAGRHREQVAHGCVVVLAVEVRVQFVGVEAAEFN